MKHLTDRELIIDLQNGSKKAFGILFNRHSDSILNRIDYKIRNISISQEILHDTFIKACTSIQSGLYMEKGYFNAWLTCIAKNLVVNHFRKNKKKREYEVLQSSMGENANSFFDSLLIDEGENIEDVICKNETYQELYENIKKLGNRESQIIQMRSLDNPTKEIKFSVIAEQLGIQEGTAKKTYFDGKKKLRKMMLSAYH